MSINQKPFTYKAFGLNIHSLFEMPELYPFDSEEPDVFIQFGEVPEKLENPEREGVVFQLTKNEYLMQLDGVASYYVSNGERIIVCKQEGSTLQEVRLFILNSAFPALLYLRNTFLLHANAIKYNDECFLICGNTGAGKSTLTTEFINHNYRILSDDISALSKIENHIYVKSSFPFLKLWQDSLEYFDMHLAKGHKLRKQMKKYGFRLQEEFYTYPLPVRNVFILIPYTGISCESEILTGINKFNALKTQTFQSNYLLDYIKPLHFQLINNLANQANIFILKRVKSQINPKNLREQIERLLVKRKV